jgi:hypothetical protein
MNLKKDISRVSWRIADNTIASKTKTLYLGFGLVSRS